MNNIYNNPAADERERKNRKIHNVVLYDRKQMTIAGVVRVDNFNENIIVLATENARMTVEGESLHISRLSLETGDMNIDGSITGLFYSDNNENDNLNNSKSPKFFAKLFK